MRYQAVRLGVIGVLLAADACHQQPKAEAAPKKVAAAAAVPAAPSGLDAADERACQFARDSFAASEPYEADELPSYLVRSIVTAKGERMQIVTSGSEDDSIEMADGKDVAFTALPGEQDRWDSGKYFLPFEGRIYLLSFVGQKAAYLHTMYRLTDDRRAVPTCLFKPKATVFLQPALDVGADSKAQWAVCNAVSKKQVEYVAERKTDGKVPDRYLGVGQYGGVEGEVTADYDNDGSPDRLLRAELTTSASHGCGAKSLLMPGDARSATQGKLLEQWQDPTPGDDHPKGPYGNICFDAPKRLFRLGGQTYLETRSGDALEPRFEAEEYWLVSTIQKGRVHRLCEASYVRDKPEIIGRWDGTDWTPRQKPEPE